MKAEQNGRYGFQYNAHGEAVKRESGGRVPKLLSPCELRLFWCDGRCRRLQWPGFGGMPPVPLGFRLRV